MLLHKDQGLGTKACRTTCETGRERLDCYKGFGTMPCGQPDRQTDRHRDTDRQTDRQADRQTQRHKQRHRQRERKRMLLHKDQGLGTKACRKTWEERQTDRDRDKDRNRDTDRDRHRLTDRMLQGSRFMHKCLSDNLGRERERQAQTQTQTQRQRRKWTEARDILQEYNLQ